MKIKSINGFVGTDLAIAIVAIIAFSGLVFTLMYQNYLENVKMKKAALASMYLSQTMENIGIEDYNHLVQANLNDYIPSDMDQTKYTIVLELNEMELTEQQLSDDIVKKVTATIFYEIGNHQYQYAMVRTKIKE